MSKFTVGTIVLLRIPSDNPAYNTEIPNDTIGEVKEAAAFTHEITIGNVAVEFPRYKSTGHTGWWDIPVSWLIPLSDPDIDVTEDEKQPVEESV